MAAKVKKNILLVALATVQLHSGEQIFLEALVGRELLSRLRVSLKQLPEWNSGPLPRVSHWNTVTPDH